MTWKTLDDMDLTGKLVLTRVDLNVPVDGATVTDTTRIERIVPTITDILAKGGTPVMLAHFGRPKGQPNPDMSLRIVVPALTEALGRDVTFVERPDRASLEALPDGAVVLVENTRFTAMEEANDPRMAQFLASLGDVYCNDAFSAAHRAHASKTPLLRSSKSKITKSANLKTSKSQNKNVAYTLHSYLLNTLAADNLGRLR